jgi:hypothetical protein
MHTFAIFFTQRAPLLSIKLLVCLSINIHFFSLATCQYRRYAPPDKGQLAEQLRRTVVGEALLSNGPKPVVEGEEEEEETMDVPDDDDDLGLGW